MHGQAAGLEVERRQHDDQQRPEVLQQVDLHRRRMAQGGEEQGVRAENATNAHGEGPGRHGPVPDLDQADQAADGQGHARAEEDRQVAHPDA